MTIVPANVRAEMVALTAATSPTAEPSSRTITGLIVQYDVVGNTSAGPTIFAGDGSVEFPADLSRVKLLLDHDPSRPVGYMTAVRMLPHGIEGTFYVPAGDAGDKALSEAASKLRDGLSVGASITDYTFDASDRLVVRGSLANETSLVSIPAFRDTIVSGVTASRKDQIVSRRKLHEIAASATATGDTPPNPAEPSSTPTEPSSTSSTSTTPAEPSPSSTPTAEPSSTPSSSSSTSTPPATEPTVEISVSAARATDAEIARLVRAAVREAPRTANGELERTTGLRVVAQMIYDTLQADGSASRVNQVIQAALSDVTPSNISTTDYGPTRPAYVNDLWTAADVARPMMDAFGTRELTKLKMQGHVWETRPEVVRYAGNKADVPSNAIKRKRLDATAQRFAGGWDVDRAFVDLPGDVDEVEDILVEATKSYMEQSEAYVAETVAAAATPLYGDAVSVPAALAVFGSYFAKLRGSRLDVIQMGTAAWEAFANMTEADAPWWLRSLGTLSFTTNTAETAGLRFSVNVDLPETEIQAADRRAVTVWEKNPPVKVRAVDVARGGVDIGVFGYVAVLVNDPRAVVNLDTAGRTEA